MKSMSERIAAGELISTDDMKSFLSDHLEDRETIMKVLEEACWPNPQMRALPDKLADDEEIVYMLVMRNIRENENFSYASARLRKDKELIRRILHNNNHKKDILSSCDEAILADRDYILSLDLPKYGGSPYNGFILKYLSDELKDDEEIVYQCCQSDVGSIRYASDRLKNDKEFVLSILGFHNSTGSFDYILAGEPILSDSDFVRRAFDITGDIDFEHAPDDIKKDMLLVYKALDGKPMPYYYCVDAMMGMYHVYSPFDGIASLHIDMSILNNPDFAKRVANQYFASEIGKKNIDKYPHNNITAIYDVMYEIALGMDPYWYGYSQGDIFDFSKEIEELEKD